MPSLINMSDIIISRSGSSTTNEIIFSQKPSILIPFPYAVDNHQYFNATSLSKINCSKIIRNKDLNYVNLSLEIFRLLNFQKNRVILDQNYQELKL